MLGVYKERLVGPVPRFPREIEEGIDRYLALRASGDALPVSAGPRFSVPPPFSTPVTAPSGPRQAGDPRAGELGIATVRRQ
jgi:hypothetical protein